MARKRDDAPRIDGILVVSKPAGPTSHDIVALVPIIERAGGVVTTWDGARPEAGGRIVASVWLRPSAAAAFNASRTLTTDTS